MNLIDKVNEAGQESFDKWFERWYAKMNLENAIIQSAQKGYSAYRICIKGAYDSYPITKEKEYLNRRLRDERTVKKLMEILGEGFKVKYEKDLWENTNFFNQKIVRWKDGIYISWEEQSDE